jgi:DNA-binding transcriptional regulator YiaG
MRSKLKERFERLGRTRDIGRAQSGSPVDLVLRPRGDKVNAIEAALLLTHSGMTMLRAKRAIEAMLEKGEVVVHVPKADLWETTLMLFKSGIEATKIATDPVDVRALRERLGMTQEQFARRYNLDLDALQNWEQGRRPIERATASYLRVIAAQPEIAARAQEERPEK